MLFMGTTKYPEENCYSSFLSSHGGFSNAYTSQEDTVYYFDVLNDHFEQALDIFSAFFWCPTFAESSTYREMEAVDNENTKNLQSDMWRNFQLLKHHAKPGHPFSMFSTGNIETLKNTPERLGLNIRERLLDFHQSHYSANIMRVVVYGVQELDVLEGWAIEKFGLIENKNLPPPSFPEPPYGPEQLGQLIETIPVKDVKELDISFYLPPVRQHYRYSSPSFFVSANQSLIKPFYFLPPSPHFI